MNSRMYTMRKYSGLKGVILLVFLLCSATAFSQTVVVTDDGSYTTGNSSSVLDVKSTTKGFLMPRVTAAQRTAISSPATGLMVYQTDGTAGFYYYNGSTWIDIATSLGSTSISTLGTVTTGTWNATTIGTTYGGTGLTSYTLGDVTYASATNTLSKLAGNTTTTKQFLSQTGNGSVSAAPVWSTVTKSDVGLGNVENTALSTWAGTTNITTLGTISSGTWSGTTIGTTKGGTGLTSYTLGDVPYASASNTLSNLAGNTTTTRKVLTQTGNGSVSAAPAWNQLGVADISDIASNYSPLAGSSSITTVGTVTSGVWSGTAIGTTKGGTGLTSYTLGDVPYASASNTLSNLAGNTTTTRKFMNQTGNGSVSAAPTWSALVAADIPDISATYAPATGSTSINTLGTVTTGTWSATAVGPTKGGTGLTSYTLGDIPYASATNTLSKLAGNITTTKQFLGQAGNGSVSAAPTWNTLTVNDISDIATTYSPINGSTDINYVGVVGVGLWNATAIAPDYGGTGLTSYTLGDITYASDVATLSKLSGNTTTTRKVLTQTGNGSASAAPAWNQLGVADISDIASTYSPLAGSSSITTLGTVTSGTWSGTTIGTTKGGTGLTSYTLGDIPYASASNTLSNLSGNTTTTKKFLNQTGNGSASAAPSWNALAATDIDANVSNTEFSYLDGVTSSIQTQIGTKAVSGTNTDITSVTLNQTGLNVKGATSTALTIKPNETLTSARTLNLITNDASRTINMGGDITTAGAFSTSGANALTLTTTGSTNVTLPTTGTLVNSAVTSLSSLATVGTITSGTWNGTTIATTRGGTGLTSYTLGDIPYASAANTLTNLAGNTTATKMFLSQTGTGSVSDDPAWSTVTKSDVGLDNVENTALSTWAGTSNITTLGTVTTGTWNATAIDATKVGGGTVSNTEFGYLDGRIELNVAADQNITSATLVDITDLTTGTLATGATYEFEATLMVSVNSGSNGVQVGTNVTVAPTYTHAIYTANTTSATVVGNIATNANNTAEGTTLIGYAGQGLIKIHGMFTTAGSGSPVFSIRLLKRTSQTATVRQGSTLKIRKTD